MSGLKKISTKIWLLAFCFCIFCSGIVSAAQAEDSLAGAKAGIVEVQSGFLDNKGNFCRMKSGSGFLIANKTDNTYIITNCSNVTNTSYAIKKYCKRHSIDTENMQFSNYIQIVVKGDVTAEAQILIKSAEKDYCVLSTANVASQKESLKLGDSAGAAVNDLVYAYGFLKEAGAQGGSIEYSAADVKMLQGLIIENGTHADQNTYLAHTVPTTQGYAGGPLLDADGYVVGLNCKPSEKEDTGIAYALPINEIRAVLDNFSIYYRSREIDEAYARLQKTYEECVRLHETGGYKQESVQALEQALNETEEVLRQEESCAADLEKACQTLLTVKGGLVPKTKMITILMIGLAGCNVILFLLVLVFLVKSVQEKKMMQRPQYQTSQALQTQNHSEYSAYSVQNAEYTAMQLRNTGHQEGQAPPSGRRLHLMREKTGELITVSRNRFVMGKNPSAADYCITDNQTVSRKHAVLFENNGSWYINDLNSLNGTYVNGSKILPGQTVRLNNGDEIVLSDEAFLVQG